MHKPLLWLCLSLAAGVTSAVLPANGFVFALGVCGLGMTGVLLLLRYFVIHAQHEGSARGDRRASKPHSLSRLRIEAASLPMIVGAALVLGALFGQMSLQHRVQVANILLASASEGTILCQGVLDGPLETHASRVDDAFRVTAIYTGGGLVHLHDGETVWLDIALPKVSHAWTGPTVLRAYATQQQLGAGVLISDYVHLSRVPRGPFATALRRRGILVLGSSSLYGVTVLAPARTLSDAWTLYGAVLNELEAATQQVYGKSAAPWLLAVGLGDHVGLGTQVVQTLAGLGAVHALIASGATLNMTVAPLVWHLRASRIRRTLIWYPLAALLLVILVLITGFSLPVLRAGIVYLYRLSCEAVERTVDPRMANALAIACIALWQPDAAWDPGVLLSFAAALLLGPVSRALGDVLPRRGPRWLRHVVIRGVAAELCVTPLVALLFGQFSMVSIVINLFLYPLLEAAIPLCMALVLCALFTWPGQAFVARGVAALVGHLTAAILAVQHLPLVLRVPNVTYVEILVYLIALATVLWLARRYVSRPRSRYL